MRTLMMALVVVMAGCAGQQRAVATVQADPNEEHCMAVAERAYYEAGGSNAGSLADAAYEDAYAACTEGR